MAVVGGTYGLHKMIRVCGHDGGRTTVYNAEETLPLASKLVFLQDYTMTGLTLYGAYNIHCRNSWYYSPIRSRSMPPC